MESQWQPHLVCFIDILGFKWLSRTCPEFAEKKAGKFREIVREQVDARFKSLELKALGPGLEPVKPAFSGISDSIFITLALRPEGVPLIPEVPLLVKGLSESLFACLKESIPLRGSLAVGPAISTSTPGFDGPLLVGRPVTQAAVFENEQQWVGISMVPEATDEGDPITSSVIETLRNEGLLLRFGTPTESGIRDCWVVTWPGNLIDESVERVWCEYQNHLTDIGVAAKYLGTLSFLFHQSKKKGTEHIYDVLEKKGLICRGKKMPE